jgi:hypothetical protein
MKSLFIAALLSLSLPALAEDKAPPNPSALADAIKQDPTAVQPDVLPAKQAFGGCVGASKNICFAPSVSLTLAAINLQTKKIEGAFSPGVGYGFLVDPGKWSSFGASFHFVLDPGAQQASAALMLSLINGYIRAGIDKGFIGDTSWRLMFGTGVPL